eukprot:scaffold56354_cov61-Phaeocystis_antarctica.AAC.3
MSTVHHLIRPCEGSVGCEDHLVTCQGDSLVRRMRRCRKHVRVRRSTGSAATNSCADVRATEPLLLDRSELMLLARSGVVLSHRSPRRQRTQPSLPRRHSPWQAGSCASWTVARLGICDLCHDDTVYCRII